jgi:predicted ATPase/class 3 adenylate cyclase
MSSLPSGTVTFLFTDIEGSTKLAHQYPSQWELLRGRHHAILQAAVDAQNGYVFQIIGDAFCVAFSSASEALNAALEAQRCLLAEDWWPAPIKVRMGIHTGTAQLKEDGQYIGYTSLAMTQRIMSAGHGGQVLLSGATRELVRDMLPANASLLELGEKRLKDLQRPESLYQLSAIGLPVSFPPLKTLDSFPNNLPSQLTTFIGREQEIIEIREILQNHRLVTLTGSGGTGKTRLSLQAAADSLETFKHGVWFVELAPLTDPDLILQTILSTIGISEQPGKEPFELLKEYLQGKITLIVLDNCEHLVAGSARVVNALLSAVPGLKVLASSREALGVQGEAAYPVPSLSLPDPNRLPALEQVSQYEAVRLFIDRALLVQPHFAVTNQNAPAVAQICHRLDGIPLAIELAASRVKALSPDQIARRLDDRFRLLTGGSRTALERHQTLRAALDWSYNLLTEDEKVLLCRLSGFMGGWTLEAAEQVCSLEGIEFNVLDQLTQLVDKSLVNAHITGRDSRYSMLETTRQYGAEKLFDSDEGELLHQKHADYFLALAEQADKEIHGPHQLEWIDNLETERDNLRVALDWSLTAGHTEVAARFFNSLNWGSYMRGHFSELNEWFKKITALDDIERYPLQLAGVLTNIGIWEWMQPGKLSDALAHLSKARSICMELGVIGERHLAWALTWLCVATRGEGSFGAG